MGNNKDRDLVLFGGRKDSDADNYLQSTTSIKLLTAETPHNTGTLVMFDEELSKLYEKMGLNKTPKGESDEDRGAQGVEEAKPE